MQTDNKNKKIKTYFNQKEKLSLKDGKYFREVNWLVNFLLAEDLDKTGDVTSDLLLKKNQKAKAYITAKENGILAGLEEIVPLLKKFNLQIKTLRKDGEKISKNKHIAIITGNIKDILKTERVILNILQRMSGIATLTKKISSHSPLVCSTRKTPWGLLDKKAVTIGGGGTHRLGLYDWILVKDNHIAQKPNFDLLINHFFEIECKTEKQIDNFLKLKPDAIMLDNFSPDKIKKITPKIRKTDKNIIIEASGGINLKNFSAYQKTGVDIISIGALTHSAKVLDISLNIK